MGSIWVVGSHPRLADDLAAGTLTGIIQPPWYAIGYLHTEAAVQGLKRPTIRVPEVITSRNFTVWQRRWLAWRPTN
jgi:hypothetical protein